MPRSSACISRGNGQPFLDADRIDVSYSLRDLLPGSQHRFGLLSVTIDRPFITLIHNQNGTYNISLPPSAAAGPAHIARIPTPCRCR